MATETLGAYYNHTVAEIESFIDRHFGSRLYALPEPLEGRLTDVQASRARACLAMRKKYDEIEAAKGREIDKGRAIVITPLHAKQ